MGVAVSLPERVYTKTDIPRILKALELYYNRFETTKGVTFNYACGKNNVNPVDATDFIIDHSIRENPLGMPSDRKDALEYLSNLRRLGKKLL